MSDLDPDPVETQEWLDALESVISQEGVARANFLLKKLIDKAIISGGNHNTNPNIILNTPYRNSIRLEDQIPFPGDLNLEQRVRALIRWNAMAMVVRASHKGLDLGGHIGSFASSATLYDIGFNHFWRAGSAEKSGDSGDLVYIQGHISPGIYARAYLEGRLSDEQLDNFRQETDGNGLSSYPHPWLMPTFWQFPTVSMGLGPLQAIYQAKFMRYMQARDLSNTNERLVWCFCGDGEMDEPESTGALAVAGREKLDNLIFVVNCNLQRLDGPVRGNGKIIQELESLFKGAGWNVIKVIWGRSWDPLLQKDTNGLLQKRMDEVVDGEYQNYKAHGGEYTRENFFGVSPELKDMVKDFTDEDIWRLERGGHDPEKIYAAYHAAVKHKGQPTVILAKTVKGYGLGSAGEGLNTAHNTKKLNLEQLKEFRDRFGLAIPDNILEEVPYYCPDKDSPEIKYLLAKRAALGGFLPQRRQNAEEKLPAPKLDLFANQTQGSGEREISTTMAFVRILTSLCKDKKIGKRIVPIVPDEARTFGMEGLFRQLGIYSSVGQLYTPVDSKQVMFYKESKDGQILEEGITEGGAFCSWLVAATSYSNHNKIMIPFYIYYSMFGLQRIGDLAWAAGDCRARGFLIGATSGRTTLNGEGLQHEDGHSHILANTIPNCRSYDPCFNYELAVIIQDGLKAMLENSEDVFYYITTMNENYSHPALSELPKGAESGIKKGLYKFKSASKSSNKSTVQLLGSGSILREVISASELLKQDFNIDADIWSATSFNLLARDGQAAERWNRINVNKSNKSNKSNKISYVTECLDKTLGPIIAATDYMKQYAEQIRNFIPSSRRYVVLGTDGFGRSDSRENLRKFFEVDRYYIVVTALKALADDGKIELVKVEEAIQKYKIDINKSDPLLI